MVSLKCAVDKIIRQGGPLPKRDIVDTTFHASCQTCQKSAEQAALPTPWGIWKVQGSNGHGGFTLNQAVT